MKKKFKPLLISLMQVMFLAFIFLIGSCSFGGSDKGNGDETTEVATTDDTQKQEMRQETSDIEEMDSENIEEVSVDEIFIDVEKMPEYPGGEDALMKYLSENIEYPTQAKEEGIEGKVFVSFVVNKDGKVGDVKVKKGIGGGCDEEAVRVVKNMPAWSPGFDGGKPVKVEYTIPINFSLR